MFWLQSIPRSRVWMRLVLATPAAIFSTNVSAQPIPPAFNCFIERETDPLAPRLPEQNREHRSGRSGRSGFLINMATGEFRWRFNPNGELSEQPGFFTVFDVRAGDLLDWIATRGLRDERGHILPEYIRIRTWGDHPMRFYMASPLGILTGICR